MKFISYYTKGDYEKVINDYLLPSLKKWDLSYEIKEIEGFGNWNRNTGYKSTFIKEMLLKHKEDVCFIDADATIESYPDLLFKIPNEYNIAIHFLQWMKFWRNIDNHPQKELLSGTMVVKYKKSTLKLLDEWIKQVNLQQSIKEQKVLEKFLLNSNYKVYDLPPSYCAIIKFDGSIPEYIGEPVIKHHQVSRKFRNSRKN